RSAVRHGGDAGEGAVAPAAWVRVVGVRVVVVLAGDRGSSRRDLPGESPAARDADPLAHLLLDAAGGGRDEVPAGRVEEEHGGGVDLEQVTHTLEHLGQHLLDPEVRSGEPRGGKAG